MKRLPALDGVRGVAILLVLLHHYIDCLLPPGSFADSLRAIGFGLTWSGVDLFFVLSGFLIAGILFDNREASNYFQVFYARRVCRIFPLYFAVLAAHWLVLAVKPSATSLLGDALPAWSYATFTQNYVLPATWRAPVMASSTWSLAVEEQFYLVIPLLVWLLPRRWLVGAMVLVIAGAVVSRTEAGHERWVHCFTHCRADALAIGVLLAAAVRSPTMLAALRRRSSWIAAGTAHMALGCLAIRATPGNIHTLAYLWLAVMYGGVVLLAYLGRMSRVLTLGPLVWLGQRSYGIYLFHVTALAATSWAVGGVATLDYPRTGLAVTLATATTFLVAEASFRWFETPFLRLGQKSKYAFASPEIRGAAGSQLAV